MPGTPGRRFQKPGSHIHPLTASTTAVPSTPKSTRNPLFLDDPATAGSLIGCSSRTPRALEILEPKPPQAGLKGAGGVGETALQLYIGATALTEQLPVLTANGDHFERMDDVTVVDWTSF